MEEEEDRWVDWNGRKRLVIDWEERRRGIEEEGDRLGNRREE